MTRNDEPHAFSGKPRVIVPLLRLFSNKYPLKSNPWNSNEPCLTTPPLRKMELQAQAHAFKDSDTACDTVIMALKRINKVATLRAVRAWAAFAAYMCFACA